METIERQALKQLYRWKEHPKRKPLIVRGARQVGKTTLIKQFAESFEHRIVLNLEKPADAAFFEEYGDVRTLKEALFLAHNIPPAETGNTILFLDEIQESPAAIGMLRYFFEDIPDLFVVAAGSLLEFAIKNVRSFPVGRVEYMNLHPLNFEEYLSALGKTRALEQLQNVPVQPHAHHTLIQLFNQYAITGGMPEVVSAYAISGSVSELPPIYESIWATYKSDIEKYTSSAAAQKVLRHILNVAYLHLDERVKFQNFGNSNYRSREVGEAFGLLNDARVIRLYYPTTDREVPAAPDRKKSPRMQFLDTGLVNYELGVQTELLRYGDLSQAYKGALIPHLIVQELISVHGRRLYDPMFWVREKTQSSSEVDLVYTHGEYLIPVEVKSGPTGKLRSLHEFVERSPHAWAVRMYAGDFQIEQHETPKKRKQYTLMNLPYYLGTQLPKYIQYLVDAR